MCLSQSRVKGKAVAPAEIHPRRLPRALGGFKGTWRVNPNGEKAQKIEIGVCKKDNLIFHFCLGLALEQQQSCYSTKRDLANGERSGEMLEPSCQMPYAYLLIAWPFHTIPYSGKKVNYVYVVWCANIRTLTNFELSFDFSSIREML